MCQNLDTKEGVNDIYKMTKPREKREETSIKLNISKMSLKDF
jgi:hypothetical protein